MRLPRLRAAAAALALALAPAAMLAGCGKSASPSSSAGGGAAGGAGGGGSTNDLGPTVVVTKTGSSGLTTTNTTRLGGGDAPTDAAAVARAVYPGLTPSTRPPVVALVDVRDWRSALAASVLMSSPLGAPLLYSDGGTMPDASAAALKAMAPAGAAAIGGAQVIRVGAAAASPSGYSARTLAGANPLALAASIEQLSASAHGTLPHNVLIVAADGPPAFAMPAAGLSAESGAPILFVTSAGIPPETIAALSSLQQPALYVVGPQNVVPTAVVAQLRRFGRVRRIHGSEPVSNAIAVARFTDGAFGWGVVDPGHGLVFANSSRPLDAAAAAPLSASGQYGPLLLLDSPDQIPPALSTYLSSIQPGYTQDPRYAPVRGVYNRGWLIGDGTAISSTTQAQLDSLLEITLRTTPPTNPITAP